MKNILVFIILLGVLGFIGLFLYQNILAETSLTTTLPIRWMKKKIPELTLEAVKNDEYVIEDRRVKLNNGYVEFETEDSMYPTRISIDEKVSFDDLNNDELKDAVVILDVGAKRSYAMWLAGMLNQNGKPYILNTVTN